MGHLLFCYADFDTDADQFQPVTTQPSIPAIAEAARKGRTAFVTNEDEIRIPVRIYW